MAAATVTAIPLACALYNVTCYAKLRVHNTVVNVLLAIVAHALVQLGWTRLAWGVVGLPGAVLVLGVPLYLLVLRFLA